MANSRTIEVLDFGEFLSMMRDQVKNAFGEGYDVNTNHVIKNNSIELDGITILKENERVTPNIYMNSYYERYMEGEDTVELVEEIVGIYMDSMMEGDREVLSLQYELEEMKSCIIYRLINFDKNRRLLEEIPHIRFLDLAITFHCIVKNSDEGIGTIRITNEHMNNWGTDIEKLKEYARKNTPRIFPAVIKNLNEVILDIFKKDIEEMTKNESNSNEKISKKSTQASAEEMLEVMTGSMEQHKSNDMYVISNTKGINGASCLLYHNIIKDLADKLNTDFYILPSSIHEIILVKVNEHLDKNLLKNMVIDVNQTQVPEEEILSDTVYYYSRKRDAITM